MIRSPKGRSKLRHVLFRLTQYTLFLCGSFLAVIAIGWVMVTTQDAYERNHVACIYTSNGHHVCGSPD